MSDSVAERFWSKVDTSGDCWEWTAGKTASGYGNFKRYGKDCVAHRVSFELVRGEIPDGLVLDHLCRNHACVNPAHLEPVTRWENVRRGVGYTAQQARKTHCKRGHEFTPENTYPWRSGRICRACRAEYSHNRFATRAEREAK